MVGGTPYTPINLEASANRLNWDFTGREVLNFNQYNSLRFSPFHQLDLRVDKEWFLDKLTLNLYFDVQNLYNFKTEGTEFLVQETNDNGKPIIDNADDPLPVQRYSMIKETTEVGTILPTVGIIIKF